MHDSLQTEVSLLRQLRKRAGCSANELARIAGVASNTVLNAERGSTPDPTTQTSIENALAVVLQRSIFARLADARAALTRAQVELEAAQDRVTHAEEQHVHDVEQMRLDIAALWTTTNGSGAMDVPEVAASAA